jgi:L-rhamnose mutarotase
MKIPTEQEYKDALKVIKQYENSKERDLKKLQPAIYKELAAYFKNTDIKKFSVELETNSYFKRKVFEVTSINPVFDEDYDCRFDEDMDEIGKKFGVEIFFEPGNTGK